MQTLYEIKPNTLAQNLRFVKKVGGMPNIVINEFSRVIFDPFYKVRTRHGAKTLNNANRTVLRKIFEQFHTTKTRVHDLARRVLQERIRESAQFGRINAGHRRQLRFWAWLWIATRRKTGGGQAAAARPPALDPTALVKRMLHNASGGGWPAISNHNFSINEKFIWIRQGGPVASPRAAIPANLTRTPPSAYTLVSYGPKNRKVHGGFAKRVPTNIVATAANLKAHMLPLYESVTRRPIHKDPGERRNLLARLEEKNLAKRSAHSFANKIINAKLAAPNVNRENLRFWVWLHQSTRPTNQAREPVAFHTASLMSKRNEMMKRSRQPGGN